MDSNQIFLDVSEADRFSGRIDVLSAHRMLCKTDAEIIDATHKISAALTGIPIGVSVGAAALLIVLLAEQIDSVEFDLHLATKLRQVADLLDKP